MNNDARREAEIRGSLSGGNYDPSRRYTVLEVEAILRLLDEARSAPRAEITEEERKVIAQAICCPTGCISKHHPPVPCAYVYLLRKADAVIAASRAYRDAEIARLRREYQDLHDAADRVCRKYGADSDWTEWTNLRDALAAEPQQQAGEVG